MDGYKMRKFVITGGRYGGECVVGRISEELYETIKDLDEEELCERIYEIEESDLMDNRPWYEVDDFEHINAAYADGGFFVCEIKDGEADFDTEIKCDGVCILGREAYSYHNENLDLTDKVKTPILTFHSAEKGSFGEYYVELEGDFNPDLLQYTIVETDVGEFIDEVYYDQKQLEADYDYADTTGKGTYAATGIMVEDWWDSKDKYTEEVMAEHWADALAE